MIQTLDEFRHHFPFRHVNPYSDRSAMDQWAKKNITTAEMITRLTHNNHWPSYPPSEMLIEYIGTLGYRRND